LYHQPAYFHPANITREPSAIIAASSVFGPTVGELPDSVARRMGLPEAVRTVHVDNFAGRSTKVPVMFHWAEHGQNSPRDLRADTSTYTWVAKCARDVLSNPCVLLRDKHSYRYQIVGEVDPPNSRYARVRFLKLILEHIPSSPEFGTPRLELITYIAQKSIGRDLKKAVVEGRLIWDQSPRLTP
jgi:hypothetical protein